MAENDSDDTKMDQLKQRISAFKTTNEKNKETETKADRSQGSDMAIAFRACSELIISIGVCGAIGYGIDDYFLSSPIGLITGLLIGTGVGFTAVYRITNNMDMAVGYASEHKKKKKKKDTKTNKQDKSEDDQ